MKIIVINRVPKCFQYLVLFTGFLLSQIVNGQHIHHQPYQWKSVQFVGGGFVDGIVFHPHVKDLVYCRTDMGGAYRLDPKTRIWIPLLDWLPYEDLNLMGVESIGLDPSDSNKVYLSCGTYTSPNVPNGAVLYSNNKGKTWQRTNMPFKMGGNENGRGNGERLMVDPNNGSVLFLGTRNAGLWKSNDHAISWTQVSNFPDITETMPDTLKTEQEKQWWKWSELGSGIIFIIPDPLSSKKGEASKTWIAGVSIKGKPNLFISINGGEHWQPIQGQPTQFRPNHAVLSSEGVLVISYGTNPGPGRMTDGAVWKWNLKTGTWTDITPEKPNTTEHKGFGFASVAVDPQNPNTIIASSFYRPQGDELYRSINGGKTWKRTFEDGGTYDFSLAPYVAHTGIHWLFDIEIDPFNSNHALFTTGFGGFETFNLTAMDKSIPTLWSVYTTGIEETVPLALLSPPSGASVITGIGDYGGGVYWNVDQPLPEGNYLNPHFGNTDDIACADKKPEIIVRVGNATQNLNVIKSNIGYSLDEGRSWHPTKTMPYTDSRHGHIAVSPNGASWIWTPENSMPFVTNNRGQSWTICKGVPEGTRIVANKINSSKFYGMDIFNGILYLSNDSGFTFTSKPLILPGGLPSNKINRGDSRGGQDRIYTTPGFENHLWIAAFDGLFFSNNEGQTFIKFDDITEMHGFGFGQSAPGSDYPVIYMVGVVNGIRGFFRSDDGAKNWTRINDDQHQYGLVLQITGDPKKYGRVYLGTHGRGTLYGDPIE